MKIALSVWNGRIAPLFESSRSLWIPPAEDLTLPEGTLEDKFRYMGELGVQELVCGGLNRGACRLAGTWGIRVYPFVAGNREEVLEAWKAGGLMTPRFSMPGCTCRGRRAWGCRRTDSEGEIL